MPFRVEQEERRDNAQLDLSVRCFSAASTIRWDTNRPCDKSKCDTINLGQLICALSGVNCQDDTHLALAHGVHVLLCNVLAITLFAEVFEFLFRAWDPEGVEVEKLESGVQNRCDVPVSDASRRSITTTFVLTL